MANSASARKRIRRNDRRRDVNASRMSRIRTFVKAVETAIAAGDAEAARAALTKAESELMRGVSKGVVHKNTAARKVSRLSHRIKGLAESA